jgi:hypothetical protein
VCWLTGAGAVAGQGEIVGLTPDVEDEAAGRAGMMDLVDVHGQGMLTDGIRGVGDCRRTIPSFGTKQLQRATSAMSVSSPQRGASC